jgi:hypothetical protein
MEKTTMKGKRNSLPFSNHYHHARKTTLAVLIGAVFIGGAMAASIFHII